MAFDALLDMALRAALAGGEAVMRVYADPFEVTHKDDKTPVTEADLASERVIVEMLTKAFPDIPVVSEETVPEAGFAEPAARFWVVDPLDGTREFVARNGEFAVLIGLVENGRPVLGVVHGPAIDVTYVAHGPGTAMGRRAGVVRRRGPTCHPGEGRDPPVKRWSDRRVGPGLRRDDGKLGAVACFAEARDAPGPHLPQGSERMATVIGENRAKKMLKANELVLCMGVNQLRT